eukprot:542986_1
MSAKMHRVTENSISNDGNNTSSKDCIITTNVIGTENNTDNVSKMGYFVGVGFILCAGLALQFQSCLVKFGRRENYKPFQLLLTRGIVQLFLTGIIDVYDKCLCTTSNTETPKHNNTRQHNPKNLGPQNKTDWMYIVIRGILGFLTAYCVYCALALLPLGDFATIFATFPIWTIIFASIFLKEKFKLYHFIALILGIVGVTLISQPSFFI